MMLELRAFVTRTSLFMAIESRKRWRRFIAIKFRVCWAKWMCAWFKTGSWIWYICNLLFFFAAQGLPTHIMLIFRRQVNINIPLQSHDVRTIIHAEPRCQHNNEWIAKMELRANICLGSAFCCMLNCLLSSLFSILLVRKLRNFSLQPKHTQREHTSAVPWYITRIRFAQWLYQTISVHCTATNSVFNKYYLFSAYRWSENWQFYLFLIWICNLLAVKLSFQIADCLFVLIGWAPYTQCKVFWTNLGRMVDVSFIFMEILSTQREAILFCWQNIKFDCEIVGSSVWIAWVDCVFRGTFFV